MTYKYSRKLRGTFFGLIERGFYIDYSVLSGKISRIGCFNLNPLAKCRVEVTQVDIKVPTLPATVYGSFMPHVRSHSLLYTVSGEK